MKRFTSQRKSSENRQDSLSISVQYLDIVSFRLILVAAVAVTFRGPGSQDDIKKMFCVQ